MSVWDNVRKRASDLGVRAIPWIRLCRPDENEDFEDIKDRLALLAAVADTWNETLILPNYETEAKIYPPDMVADYLYDSVKWEGGTGWSIPGWLFNDTDYTPISDRDDPVLLQIFPTDFKWPKDYGVIKTKMGDCVEHARVDKGFTYVGVTYQTYDSATPSWFDVDSYQHSVYPGNLIQHGDWPKWFA